MEAASCSLILDPVESSEDDGKCYQCHMRETWNSELSTRQFLSSHLHTYEKINQNEKLDQ